MSDLGDGRGVGRGPISDPGHPEDTRARQAPERRATGAAELRARLVGRSARGAQRRERLATLGTESTVSLVVGSAMQAARLSSSLWLEEAYSDASWLRKRRPRERSAAVRLGAAEPLAQAVRHLERLPKGASTAAPRLVRDLPKRMSALRNAWQPTLHTLPSRIQRDRANTVTRSGQDAVSQAPPLGRIPPFLCV